MNRAMWILGAALLVSLVIIFFVIQFSSQHRPALNITTIGFEDVSVDFENIPSTVIQDGAILYTNAGSSSCPPVIKEAAYTSEKTIELTIQDYAGKQCTLDYSPIIQQIAREDNVNITDDTTVLIAQ